MTCPSCKTEVDENAKFCPECGARMDSDHAQQATAEADADFPVPGGNNDHNNPSPRDRLQNAAGNRQEDVEDEDDVWNGSYSPKAMVGWWIAAGVITVVVLFFSLFYFGYVGWTFLALVVGWAVLAGRYLYRRFGVHYYVTTQRFLHETGIFWRRTDRIELIDIADVTFHQGPVQRMFNVGTIQIISNDKTDPNMTLPGIDNVRHVADMIDDLRRKERRRRGLLHIESS